MTILLAGTVEILELGVVYLLSYENNQPSFVALCWDGECPTFLADNRSFHSCCDFHMSVH